METNELASSFAAKKENKELKEQIAFMAGSINCSNSLLQDSKEKNALYEKRITYLENKYDKIFFFVTLLDEYPMFWGKSYKKSIKQFFINNK